MPPAFLAEMLEAREADRDGPRQRRPKPRRLDDGVRRAGSTTLMDEVGGLFADYERAAGRRPAAGEPAARRSGVC